MRIPKFTLDNERGTYEARFYFRDGVDEQGKPRYIRPRIDTGLTDKRMAEKKAPELIEKFIKGQLSPRGENTPKAETSPLLVANIEAYLAHYYVDKLAETTARSNRGYLMQMVKYSPKGAESRVSDITPRIAGDIWNSFCETPTRLKRPPNGKGRAHFLRDVTAYWDWEVKVNKVPENPFAWIDKVKEDEFDEYDVVWQNSEYLRILEALEYIEDQEAIQVCRWAGMYPKDVFMLDTKDCKVVDGGIVVSKEREKRERKGKVKRRGRRIIRFYTKTACPEINELMMFAYDRAMKKGGGRMFCLHYTDPVLWVEQFGKRIKSAWGKQFPGWEPKPPKAFRHTRITEWRKEGVDPEIIGNRVGHVKGSKMVLKLYSHNDELEGVL